MITLSFSRTGTRELFTLGTRIKELLSNYNAEELGIKLYVDNFNEKYQTYKNSIEKQEISADVLTQKDSLRDNYFLALRGHLRNFRYHPDDAKKENANKIIAILNKEGENIHRAAYKTETAALISIINEIENTSNGMLEDLNAAEWFNLLKQAQNDFEESLKKYSENKAEIQKVSSASDNRKSFEESMRKLFMFLPMQYEMTSNTELDNLIRQLQVIADRF
ncbi:MAG: hypothetical protein JXR51_01680 [Bacteroidales bacterium]|nr:hypothetical protein [Bacteroidales bacterium]MBN2755855.1 hypothetical protein [Bacteroidales bacterium]